MARVVTFQTDKQQIHDIRFIYVQRRMNEIMDDELGRMQKIVLVASFKALP
jgi:hypothetical protein